MSIFFLSVACLTFIMTFFEEQKCNIFIKSNLLIFFFDILRLLYMKSLPYLSFQRFSPVFSYGRFLVLALMFSSMTHLELIFVYCVILGSKVIFPFTLIPSCASAICLKDCLSPIEKPSPLC